MHGMSNADAIEDANVLTTCLTSLARQVIVAGGKFGDMALHYVNKHGLMAVRLLSKFDLRRLCKTVGATALPRLTAPAPDELGYCDRVYTDELGDTAVVVFRQEAAESRIATVVVRGATDNMMDDVERAIDDGINNFKALTKVRGAGDEGLRQGRHAI